MTTLSAARIDAGDVVLRKARDDVRTSVDGATAERFLSIPEGAILRTAPDGRLALPPGSVAMKNAPNIVPPLSQ